MIIIRPVVGGFLVKIRIGVPGVFIARRDDIADYVTKLLNESPFLLNN